MEDPAVTDPTATGLDADPLRHSLKADESDCVDGIAQKDEIAPEKNEEDAISLREDGSDCADDIAPKEEKVPEKIDEDASSLTAEKSDFVDDTTHKEEAVETSDEEHTGETVQKEEKTLEEPIEKDMKIEEDVISLRVGSDCADDIAQKEEKVEGDAVSFRAAEFDFIDETSQTHMEDTGEIVQNGEKIPEKSVTDGLEIQEGSVCADNTANEEETSPENIQERETHSVVADDNDTHRNEEIDGSPKKQEEIPGKSTIYKNEKIENDATRLREEGSGFADDTDKEEEKAPHNIQEDKTSFGAESSDFADETVHKDETDVDGQREEKNSEKPILEEIEKIQDGATSSSADDSDCVDDTKAEEKSSVKSTNEQIQEKTDENAKKEDNIPEKKVVEKDKKIQDEETRLRALGYDFVDDIAQEQEKTPMNSPTEQMQEGATSLRSQVADFTEETARKVPNNHAVVKESVQKEENSQPASALPPTPERTTNPPPGAAAPSTVRPAGLGRAAPLLEPAARAVQQPRVNGTTAQMQTQQTEDSNGEVEEYDETREQLQMIRVKFLRLAHRLGQTPHNVVVAQVLYRLGLAEQLRGRNGGRVGAFSFDRASAMAEQLEASGQEPLDFSCTVMVLGKSGVGKSATINSIFDEQKFCTDAFRTGTQKVQDVVGTVQGIKVRVIDTPGLLSSWSDQRQNVKILQSVKRFIKKTPPDIVLYLDRLDMQSRDFSDMPLLRTITEIFGPSIWFNAIVVLTHAASAPPDGPNGAASGYDMFITQRSHVVQQNIRQAAGDMRLMNPISLVENHSACRTNRAGQRVLPNGQVWKPHLLLLSFASKILAEANTLLKLQDSSPGKPSATRSRAPPLPFLLSSLLQSRPQLKLPGEQVSGDEDDDLDSSSDSDNETEYDDLPPFTRLTKAQVATLTKAQRKAYFDELAYREKLFMKKQLKEERRQRRMMRNMAAVGPSVPSENVEEESDSVIPPAPMPDLALPASFDSSNPAHRYRCLDSASQWIVRPVLDTHGWDHDVGYEGVNLERFFVVKNKLPVAFSGQASKDKKDANIQMEVNSSLSHGKGKATSMGFDLQTVGKDMAYTLRGETKFLNHRRNKATAGLSATILSDALSTGVKLEDKLIINKCLRMVVAGGAMSGRGDVAYGGSLEAQLRDRDYPIGRFLSTLGLSIMDWHGDLAIGGNIQSQIPIGRSTNLIARANLNNRGAGQINFRLNSSEQLQIALFGLLPLLRKVVDQLSQMQHGQQ